MSAGGVGVHAQGLEVHIDHTGCLGPVADQQDTLGPDQRRDLGQGHHHTGDGLDVAEETNPGAGGEVVGDQLEDLLFALRGRRDLELHNLETAVFGQVLPADHAAAVFVVGGQDFVPWLQLEPGGDPVHALGGVGGEGDLVLGDPQEGSGFVPHAFDLAVQPRALKGMVVWAAFQFVQEIAKCLDNGARGGADGAAIEVDQIRGVVEFVAHPTPARGRIAKCP